MALDTSQYYTDPKTGTTYTSYASFQQNTQGQALPGNVDPNTGQAIPATPSPAPAPTPVATPAPVTNTGTPGPSYDPTTGTGFNPATDTSNTPPAAAPVAPSPAPTPTPTPPPIQQTAPLVPLSQLIGTRPSASNSNVTEYYNASNGQGFSRPQDLFSFLGGHGYKINDFNALQQQMQGGNTSPTTGSFVSSTPATTSSDGATVPGTPAPNAATGPAASVLDSYGVSATPGVSPLSTYTQAYTQVLSSLGLGDINTEIKNTEQAYTDLQSKKEDEITSANENPWYSESDREAKLQAITNDYAARESDMTGQLSLYNSIYQNGISEANFVATQATSAYQFDVTTKQQLDATALTNATNAKSFALSESITQPFYNIGGTIYRTSDGFAFSTPQQFQQITGLSLGQAAGQIQTVTGAPPFQVLPPSAYGPGGTVSPTGSFTPFSTTTPTGASYNFAGYNSNPGYASDVTSLANQIGPVATSQAADSYIQAVAPGAPVSGDMIQSAAKQYGIDPSALMAVIQKESMFGTSSVAGQDNNPGGMTFAGQPGAVKGSARPAAEGGNYAAFPNMQAGVNDIARRLSELQTNGPTVAADANPPDPTTANIPDPNLGGYTPQYVYNSAIQLALDKTKTVQSFLGGLSGSAGPGLKLKTAITSKSGAILSSAGINDVAELQREFAAGSTAMNTQVGYLNQVQGALTGAELGAQKTQDLFANNPNINQFASTTANATLNDLTKQFGSSADIRAYQAAMVEIGNEYAQVFARGGQRSVQGTSLAQDVISGNVKLSDMQETLTTLQQIGQTVVQARLGQIQTIADGSGLNVLSQFITTINGGQTNTTQVGGTDLQGSGSTTDPMGIFGPWH